MADGAPRQSRTAHAFTAPVERFFAQLGDSGALPQGMPPAFAAHGVLCALAGQLSIERVSAVATSLPGSMQPLMIPCAAHASLSRQGADLATFVEGVAEHLGTNGEDSERIVREVFARLREHLPRLESARIAGELSPDLAELWRWSRATEPETRGESSLSII